MKNSCCIFICLFSILSVIIIDCKIIQENIISEDSNKSESDEIDLNKEDIKTKNKFKNNDFPLYRFSNSSKKYVIKNGELDAKGKKEAALAKHDVILRKQILNALEESKRRWNKNPKNKLIKKIKRFNQATTNMQIINNRKTAHQKVTQNSKEEMGLVAEERKYIPYPRIPSVKIESLQDLGIVTQNSKEEMGLIAEERNNIPSPIIPSIIRESLKDIKDEKTSIINSDFINERAGEIPSGDNAEMQQKDENISSFEDNENVSVKMNKNESKENLPDSLPDDEEDTEEMYGGQTEPRNTILPANSLRISRNQDKLRKTEDFMNETPCAYKVKMLAHSYKHKAPTNSTIEVSDTEYQDYIADEESEDENALINYPYTVSIQRKGAHYASGALVGKRWVLSTAAEFFNVRETIKLFKMRLGSVDCKKGGILVPLKSITIHPEYMILKTSYDLSVLSTAGDVYSDVIKPIPMSRVTGNILTASFLSTYWPRIVTNKGVAPLTAKERVQFNSMRVSSQKMVPSYTCSQMLATVNVTLPKSSLCLKPIKTHHSDCMPDVGAPVVALDGLWGITSGWVSPLCSIKPFPTLVTRISAPDIRTWIEKQMSW